MTNSTTKSYFDFLLECYEREAKHKTPEISLAKVSMQLNEVLNSDEWQDWPPYTEEE